METSAVKKAMNAITNIRCSVGPKCLKCPLYNAMSRNCGLISIKESLFNYASFITFMSTPDNYNEVLIGGKATLNILEKARVTGGYTTSVSQYRYRVFPVSNSFGVDRYFEVLDKIPLDKFEQRVKRNEWETVYCGYLRGVKGK